jgi:hypothetical protein
MEESVPADKVEFDKVRNLVKNLNNAMGADTSLYAPMKPNGSSTSQNRRVDGSSLLENLVAQSVDYAQGLDLYMRTILTSLYSMYDYIYDQIPEVASALYITKANLLTPDDIGNAQIMVLPSEDLDAKTKEFVKKNTTNLIESIELTSGLEVATDDALKYGDGYLSINVVEKEDIDFLLGLSRYKENKHDKTVAMESTGVSELDKRLALVEEWKREKPKYKLKTSTKVGDDKEHVISMESTGLDKEFESTIVKESGNLKIAFEDSVFPQVVSSFNEKYHKIYLKSHDPKNILPLSKDETIIGYVEIIGYNRRDFKTGYMIMTAADVDNVIDSMITKLRTGEPRNMPRDEIYKAMKANPALLDVLRTRATEYENLGLKYYLPREMFNLRFASMRGGAYTGLGASMISSVRETALLYILLRKAATIFRVANAGEKWKVGVEIGTSRSIGTRIKNVVAKLKSEQVTLEDGSISSVNAALKVFKVFGYPMLDGQELVKLDKMEGSRDSSERVSELEFVLKEVISGLGTPPAMLGHEKDLTLKTTMSQQDIMFAKSIVDKQRIVNKFLTNIVRHVRLIYKQSSDDSVNDIKLALQKPKMVILEVYKGLLESLSGIVESLKDTNYKISQNFYKNIMPSEIFEEKDSIKQDIDKNLSGKSEEMGGRF